MGLIGELLLLERYFLEHVPIAAAMESWRGPLGDAQDFIIGSLSIESKAHGRDSSALKISSEFQLDAAGIDDLFLHLVALDRTEGGEEGFTVTEVADRIRNRIAFDEPSVARLDGLLAAAGYRPDDDYTTDRWRGGERGVFRVADGFPRLVPDMLPPGVANVKYTISADSCGPFVVQPEFLVAAISGVQHDIRA